ncbi:MAG: hypothetical protein HZA90_22920 [Verrucomicrobia bacterium]|nr:hypothetical protein [Verrucomicrobiota bacterium]
MNPHTCRFPSTRLTALSYVDLRDNYLDLREGSPARVVIAGLQSRATVDIDPQEVLLLSAPTRPGEGQFGFTLTAPAGTVWRVWTSSDLLNWEPSGYVTNVGNVADYFDASAMNGLRFYRVAQP